MFHTAEQARREAVGCLTDGDGLNALGGQSEWAYSPTKMTVGMRNSSEESFRIVNVNWPYYGHAEQVTDWVSVGLEKPKRGWHWRAVGGIWKQFKNVRGTKYHVVSDIGLVEQKQGESRV